MASDVLLAAVISAQGGGWMFWRLLGRADGGAFPPQDSDGFNIYNDNSAVTQALSTAAMKINLP